MIWLLPEITEYYFFVIHIHMWFDVIKCNLIAKNICVL